jgi:hypothetical protein
VRHLACACVSNRLEGKRPGVVECMCVGVEGVCVSIVGVGEDIHAGHESSVGVRSCQQKYIEYWLLHT